MRLVYAWTQRDPSPPATNPMKALHLFRGLMQHPAPSETRCFFFRVLRRGPDVRSADAALRHTCQLLPRQHDSPQRKPGWPHHALAPHLCLTPPPIHWRPVGMEQTVRELFFYSSTHLITLTSGTPSTDFLLLRRTQLITHTQTRSQHGGIGMWGGTLFPFPFTQGIYLFSCWWKFLETSLNMTCVFFIFTWIYFSVEKWHAHICFRPPFFRL